MNTSILLEHEPDARVPGRHLVRMLFTIRGEPPATLERLPLNLSLVLDRSGSMAGEKLDAVKEAAAGLVRRLWPEDLVSVVAYDHRVDVIAEPARGDLQRDVAVLIRRIRVGGMTNLSGGWLRGRELVARNLEKEGVNRVLLLTDGLANRGITDREQLCALPAKARASGITTTTIGFGSDYDEVLLRGMADAGGGHTYYIERPDQASDVFAEELEGLATLSAQNLRCVVTPASGVELTAVRHSYPGTNEGGTLRLEMGDLYARDPRQLLVEFVVRCDDDQADVPVADLTVVAAELTEDGGMEQTQMDIPVRFSPAEGPRVEPEVRRVMVLLESAQAREEALRARERGDFGGAAEKLEAIADKLERLGLDDESAREEVADLRAMADAFHLREVSEADVKYMHQRAYDTSRSMEAKKRLMERKEEWYRRKMKRTRHEDPSTTSPDDGSS